MTELIRTQILLEKKQRQQIKEIAERYGVNFSELVRSFLDAQILAATYADMQQAATRLLNDYTDNADLTELTVLDGEDFLSE